MADQKQQIRLALRVEGDWWVARVALPGTMDGAVEIGRIAMAVVQNFERKQMFMEICKGFLADLIAAKGGTVSGFETRPAPESERGGRA